MRIKSLLLTLLFISPVLLAESHCEEYITDEWPNARYEINNELGVVLDIRTGLMWKRCSEGQSGTNCEIGFAPTYAWSTALTRAQTLNSTGFAGHTDWRVPNIEELRSIAAINCGFPAINETAFPNTPSNLFWTSSAIRYNSSRAWSIEFRRGTDIPDNSGFGSHVRLVRTAD